MSGEWIRFGITAALLAFGYAAFACAVLGVWRLGFVMNRMHAGGIGDTLGLFCVALAAAAASGFGMTALKILLVVALMWLSAPVSTHFLAQLEYFTNPQLEKEVDLQLEKEAALPGNEREEDDDE